MDLTPDYSRVGSYTPEQWRQVLKENPDAVGPYLDSLEEAGDPNLDTHRYFLNLKTQFGGDKEVFTEGSRYLAPGELLASIKFDLGFVTLIELDPMAEEYHKAIIELMDGQVVIHDDNPSGGMSPVSERPEFQNVTPQNLLAALTRWWDYASSFDEDDDDWEEEY